MHRAYQATALIEAAGDGQATEGGIALVLVAVSGVLLLAGIVTPALEAVRPRSEVH